LQTTGPIGADGKLSNDSVAETPPWSTGRVVEITTGPTYSQSSPFLTLKKSDISDTSMYGLFAAIDFNEGDRITSYLGLEVAKGVGPYKLEVNGVTRAPRPEETWRFAHFINEKYNGNKSLENVAFDNRGGWGIDVVSPISAGDELYLDYGPDYKADYPRPSYDDGSSCPKRLRLSPSLYKLRGMS
tara:strand:+ start:1967 stop:2524 length:558 start_codon:yes stop_codon:yes gene_type:complete